MRKRIFILILLLGLVSVSPAQAKGGHAHHDAHAGHNKNIIRIKKSTQITAGFKRAKVQTREIKRYLNATGLIELNHDVTAHIIPRIPGKIYKVLGHLVQGAGASGGCGKKGANAYSNR